MVARGENNDRWSGQDVAVDPVARSASESLPAFLTPPPGAPPYHGFRLLESVESNGLRLGIVSELSDDDYGDAFVVAPDDSRAGLVWSVGKSERVVEVAPPDDRRLGVWELDLPRPMSSLENARENLAVVVSRLRPQWERWRSALSVRSDY